jgi:hypothetical protein
MKCLLGFFHDAGCPCSGFFHPPPPTPHDVSIMNVGWVLSSKNEFLLKKNSSLKSIYNIQSGKSSNHLGKATKTDNKY